MNYSKFFKFSLLSTTIPISYLLYKKNYCCVNLDNGNKDGNLHTFFKVDKRKSFLKEELKKYNNPKDGIYISYKDKVYNVTNFVKNHPGGESKIMLGAGLAADPYWNLYPQHILNALPLLKDMEIGDLTDYCEEDEKNFKDLYINDPNRNGNLKFHNVKPCNAENINKDITFITDNEDWYIRNHHPVPEINVDTMDYEIIFGKEKIKLKNLIEKYKIHNIISTIQCGGNRRNELNDFKKTNGTAWTTGAISNAKWSGIKLAHILNDIPIRDEKFVNFESIDGLKISIPINKCLDPVGDVLLAFKMNGEDLLPDHGYPVRLIVPGYVGIRNIKWIKSIEISEEEVEGNWQKGIAYKGLPHYITDLNGIDLNEYYTTYEQPVQSCITFPYDNMDIDLKNNEFTIKGYAYSGGGRNIIRVDISLDGGKTWEKAHLKEGKGQEFNKAWAWTLWEFKVDLLRNIEGIKKNLDVSSLEEGIKKDNDGKNYVEIVCKAVDNSYNQQPENSEYCWNIRGINNNSWHKIKINF